MEKEQRAATTRDSEKYIVRFPDGMREQIKQAAAANNRSLNAEIIARLQDTFTPSESMKDFMLKIMMEATQEIIRETKADPDAALKSLERIGKELERKK